MARDGREERRNAERVAVNREFSSLDDSFTYVTDLSETGVFIQTNKPQPIGTRIQMRFTVLLDDPVVIAGTGIVVRHQADPPGMGIRFEALDPATVLRINDVVTRQRPRDAGAPLGAEAFAAQVVGDDDLTRPLGDGEDEQTAVASGTPTTPTEPPIDAPVVTEPDGDAGPGEDDVTQVSAPAGSVEGGEASAEPSEDDPTLSFDRRTLAAAQAAIQAKKAAQNSQSGAAPQTESSSENDEATQPVPSDGDTP